MNKITELLKLESIENEFFKHSRGYIFEDMEIQEAYLTITKVILTNTIPDWEAEKDMEYHAETLKNLIGRLNLDQLKIECKLIEDIWDYSESKDYDDILDLIHLKPKVAIFTINDILENDSSIVDYKELVEAWG